MMASAASLGVTTYETPADGWTMPICEMDARPGGAWRYVYRRANGRELTLSGVVREVVPNERFVFTESWGPEWPDTLNTVEMAESDGQTTVTLTVTYESQQAREAALETGARDGMDKSFAKLEALLPTLA
jgi:uncharacterized protein YndB with AHSA1/START domain